jgi:hypothetical protein
MEKMKNKKINTIFFIMMIKLYGKNFTPCRKDFRGDYDNITGFIEGLPVFLRFFEGEKG